MTSSLVFERVGVVGLGLMGGSHARALRALDSSPHIVAFNRNREDAERALEEGVIDGVAASPQEAVAERDLVMYATPLGVTRDMMRSHSEAWGDATVTDVAGLKRPLMEEARRAGRASQFVGSHPLAGGTDSGYRAASADLFTGETVFVCVGEADPERAEAVRSMWCSLGASVRTIEADEHDRLMVWASHLPQLISNVVARAMADGGLRMTDLGPGGRDVTRLAESSPEVWTGLLDEASGENLRALASVQSGLDVLRTALSSGSTEEIAEMMRATRDWRKSL